MEDLVSIDKLNIEARTRAGTLKVVNDLSFTIKKSETLCVVGESGCCLLYTSPSPRDRG